MRLSLGRGIALGVLVLGLSAPALAQASASHRLDEYVFNEAGHPGDGVTPASASHRLTLDAIGGGVRGLGLGSATYRLDAGFVQAYRPPGEVAGLAFASETELVWSEDPSVGVYNLYRGDIGVLAMDEYGECEQRNLLVSNATDDPGLAPGDGLFYLVTAENRLFEEGPLGARSDGALRANTLPCP